MSKKDHVDDIHRSVETLHLHCRVHVQKSPLCAAASAQRGMISGADSKIQCNTHRSSIAPRTCSSH